MEQPSPGATDGAANSREQSKGRDGKFCLPRPARRDYRTPVEDYRTPVEDYRTSAEDYRTSAEDYRTPVEDSRTAFGDIKMAIFDHFWPSGAFRCIPEASVMSWEGCRPGIHR